MRLLLVIPIIVWLAAAPAACTPLGTAFTYQGKLTDSAGVPLSASYNMTFKLYDSLAGGSQVGSTVSPTGVNVSGGLFTVQLDFGASVFGASARWLETAVAGTTLSPRVQLTSVPTAIYAQSVPWSGITGAPTSMPPVLARRAVNANTTALVSDTLIGVDVTGGPVTVTLPPANSVAAGKVLVISHEAGDAGANNITIARQGSDFINTSQTSVAITFGSGGGAAFRLYSDGVSKWRQW